MSFSPHLSTGFSTLNEALLIRGLPYGRISEIIGAPTSGMATVALRILANAQDVLGLSTGDHIMTFFRTWLEKRRILSSEQLLGCPNKQTVRVAGLVVVHQAKGHHFITLEDEYGLINVIIRPKVYEAYERVLHDSRLLIVEGRAQQEEGATSLLARRIFVLKN